MRIAMSNDNLPPIDRVALEANPIAEHDRLAAAMATPKQLADLEKMPERLTYVEIEELCAMAVFASQQLAVVREVADDTVGEEGNVAHLLRRCMLAEFLWRSTVRNIGNEIHRRRTGITPRAKSLH
jgi:hypothetical protein